MLPVSAVAMDQLFCKAQSFGKYLPVPVEDSLLRQLADTAKLGPTSNNSCPARFVFIKSPEGKARLRPHVSAGNVDKIMSAPVTVIVAYDLEFYERFATLSPPGRARAGFVGKPEAIERTAFFNSSLQGAYLIMAARALGLDAGPMGGFNADGVTAEFLAGTAWRANFLCNIGYADRTVERQRGPRLNFDEFCTII